MRHLLEVLRKDLEEPTNASTELVSTELDKKENDLLDSLLPHLESAGDQVKTKKDNDLFPYASLIQNCDPPDYAEPLLVSTPLHSPETTAASPTRTIEKDGEDNNQEKGSPWLDNTGIGEGDHQNQTGTAETNSSENHEYAVINSDKGDEVSNDGQSKELEDLGRSLAESLHVSSNTQSNNVETAAEQLANTVASVSDDEF